MSETTPHILAGIEAGGTKFNCIVATAEGQILNQQLFPTLHPDQTLPAVLNYFREQSRQWGQIKALGIASFGPVELDAKASNYGHILTTPKPGWSNCNLRGFFADALSVPVGFHTDVNGALLGEWKIGAAEGKQHAVYVTIGTGIGAGIMMSGQLLQGLGHPEAGHMYVRQHPEDRFEGSCPLHRHCLEGLAAGPALNARWGQAIDLPADHPAWELEAYYVAQLCVNLTLCYCPEVIILGGGVMDQKHLFPLVREEFSRLINGYCANSLLNSLDTFIVPPVLGNQAGQQGALYLAEQALNRGY